MLADHGILCFYCYTIPVDSGRSGVTVAVVGLCRLGSYTYNPTYRSRSTRIKNWFTTVCIEHTNPYQTQAELLRNPTYDATSWPEGNGARESLFDTKSVEWPSLFSSLSTRYLGMREPRPRLRQTYMRCQASARQLNIRLLWPT